MVQNLKNGKGAIARFGNGTVRVYQYLLQKRFGGQIELTQCVKTKVGEESFKEDVVSGSNKIVLDFKSVESINVLIDRLTDLRDSLVKASR